MAEEKRYTEYSAADIRRYFTGGMTAEEMHALESAAARDPFLADALEGYGTLPSENWVPALDSLHAHFKQKKQPARISLRYMRAAAGIGLLAITIVVAYLVTRRESSSPGELAANRPTETDRTFLPLKADTTAALYPAPSSAAETKTPSAPAATAKDLTTLLNEASDSSFVYRPAPPAVTAPAVLLPPPVATDAETTTEATREESAEKSLKEYTGNAAINEAATGNASNNAAYPAIPQGNVNRQAAANRMKSARNADQAKKETRDQAMVSETAPSGAQPVGGWEQFRLYLQTKKRNPEIVRNGQVRGDVLLTLHLLEDGRIQKIEITRSLHPDCDAEALRLIREGPAWKITHGTLSGNVQVSVAF